MHRPFAARRARDGGLLLAASVLVGVVAIAVAPAVAGAAPAAAHEAAATLSAAKAAILGVVEGVTEYLPISSTGHLLVTSRLLDLPDTGSAGDALKSYEIAIQFGAILAVLALYCRRVAAMLEGVVGRSVDGRRLLTGVAVAFVPAAVVGLVSETVIKDVLFGVWPVVVAWVVGGLAILELSRRGLVGPRGGRPLEAMTARDALIIGGAQVLALWPGTSRSLVTIVAALLIGLSMQAAVEFSFLLGFVTLGAATAYEAAKDGRLMVDSFGVAVPLLGVAVAFAAAAASIKWMVGYLNRHDLAVFGWYRLAVAAATILVVAWK